MFGSGRHRDRLCTKNQQSSSHLHQLRSQFQNVVHYIQLFFLIGLLLHLQIQIDLRARSFTWCKDHPTEGTNESSPGFSPIILSPVRDNLSSMCCTCSVSSTEELLYLQLVSDPSVASRNRNRMREEAHTISSQLVRDSRNVLWLCRSCGRAEGTLFTLVVHGKKRNSPISFI